MNVIKSWLHLVVSVLQQFCSSLRSHREHFFTGFVVTSLPKFLRSHEKSVVDFSFKDLCLVMTCFCLNYNFIKDVLCQMKLFDF